jgi:hypothetical protein
MLCDGFAARMAAIGWGEVLRWVWYWRVKVDGFGLEGTCERKNDGQEKEFARRRARRVNEAMMPGLKNNEGRWQLRIEGLERELSEDEERANCKSLRQRAAIQLQTFSGQLTVTCTAQPARRLNSF